MAPAPKRDRLGRVNPNWKRQQNRLASDGALALDLVQAIEPQSDPTGGAGRLPRSAESWLHLALSKLQKATHGYLSGAKTITSSSIACLMLCVCFLEEQSRAFLEQALRTENKRLTISFGFDETQQRVTKSRQSTNPNDRKKDGQPDQDCSRPKKKVQTGRYELASFMVTTGCVGWHALESEGHGFHKEELLFVPLELQRCTAQFLVHAIVKNFSFLCPLLDLLKKVETFSCVQFLVTGDSAPANCKALPHIFSFLQSQSPNCLASFSPCLLHQLSRMLVLNMERQCVSSPLYCLSRVLQQSSLKELVARAMLVELERRFFYSSIFAVPARSSNSARYRACLSQLLFTPWDVSSAAHDAVPRSREKMTSWQLAFGFFNGDLMNEMRWEHWCTGCCSDEASSLAKAKKLLSNAFFGSMELYHPQRWHMCTPALMDWSALMLLHKVGSVSLEASGQLHQVEENDVAGAGGNAAEDDAASWRRTQARRKQRGLAFLQDKFASFHLLTTLGIASILAPLTNLCFQFNNSDKQGISLQPGLRATKRLRRRMHGKGPEAASFNEVFDRADTLHFDQVRLQGKRCVQRLWQEVEGGLQSLICADGCWPASEPAHAKFSSLTENILRNVAGLKWRVLTKFDFPPWSLAPLSAPDCKAEAVEEARLQFLDLQPCCVDPFWAKQLQEKVAKGEMDFGTAVRDYFSSMRPVSLREEQSHTIQRTIAGGDSGKAALAARQRSQSLVYGMKRNYQQRGGRNLDRAPKKVSRTYVALRKGQKLRTHRRPGQLGNTMLYFCNLQIKQHGGSTEQHMQAWREMPEETKAWWKSRHHNHVRMKRGQQKQEEAAASSQLPSAACTSWNLGCEDWPLKPDVVKKWLVQFQGRSQGLQTLKQVQGQCPEITSYIEAVESGACPYHMKDAMMLYCNNFLGDTLGQGSVQSCALTAAIVSTPLPFAGCHALHPGMCRTKDKHLRNAIDLFFKIMPKNSCVVQLKSSQLQVYARIVLGTKRPMKIFFAPLVLPTQSADPRCWFAYPCKRGDGFPKSMKLVASPTTAGIYNHWEFLKALLIVSDKWDVAICSYKQSSVQSFVITGIAERVERPLRQAQPAATEESAAAASSSKEPEIDVSFFDAPCMKQQVNSFFGGQDFAMKGAGFAAADDDDADLGHYMFEEEDEEFVHADVASEDDLQLSQAVVSEEPLGPVEKVAAEDAKSEAGMSQASASGLKTAATDFDALKKCLGDRWPLKEGYRMYFNKQNERWSLNYKNKYVKGSAARLDKHASHQGAIDHVHAVYLKHAAEA